MGKNTMKTQQEVKDHLNMILEHIIARPKMYGTNQESLWVQCHLLLDTISFIDEKEINWFRVHLDTDVTMGLPESSAALSSRKLSDEKFMEALKIMISIAKDEMTNGKTDLSKRK